jgi:NADH-quinone oxidoreductase subunit J
LRRRKDTKQLDPALAVKVKARDRVRIIKMQAESDRAVNFNATKEEGGQ